MYKRQAYAWENFGLYPDEEYTARMLVVYEAPDYVKEERKEANAQLEQKPIGRDARVFIVNENNPVSYTHLMRVRSTVARSRSS